MSSETTTGQVVTERDWEGLREALGLNLVHGWRNDEGHAKAPRGWGEIEGGAES